MRALRLCWSSWSTVGSLVTAATKALRRALARLAGTGAGPAAVPAKPSNPQCRRACRGRWLGLHHLAALDLDQIHAWHVLGAFLAGRPLLDEADIAVDDLHLDVPQRLADRLRLRFARRLDGLGDHIDAIPTAKAFGQATNVVLFLIPDGDELLGDLGVLDRLGKPGRKEHEMVGAVGGIAGLGDQLVGRIRAAGGDDALGELLILGLLQDQRDLLDRRR